MGYTPIFSNITYGLPLVILAIAALLWWWSTRLAPPPFLSARPPFRSWRVNPVAAAYEALQQDRFLLPAYLLRDRLASDAHARFGIAVEELGSRAASELAPRSIQAPSLHRVVRDLTTAYRSAYLAEGMRSMETFAGFTLPRRRRRAARDFERASREVEQLLREWGTVP